MLKTNRGFLRILTLLLAASLIFAALPTSALAASSFSAIVTASSMKVYGDARLDNYLGSLSQNAVVTVKAYSGSVAKISYRGHQGFAAVSDMSAVASVAKSATISQNTRVYKSASTSSASVRVSKGADVYVLNVSGNCAKIEKNGYTGYIYTGCLNIEGQENNLPAIPETTPAPEATPAPTATPVPETPQTIDQIFASGKYSNEELCYAFAVKVMGYNTAAACGLLANIRAESSFKPTCNGDSGTSYGVCQWHLGRKTRLISWCGSNGYDYNSLLGQLYYLKYELENYYPSVNNYMKKVENTASGAYDSAYYFCYNFEAPANRTGQSTSRANYAQTTYYPKYAA